MKKIMLALGLGGWAVAGVALGVSSASAHQSVPGWLAVYPARPMTACSGFAGVIVFDRQTWVQQAIVCRNGQVFVSP